MSFTLPPMAQAKGLLDTYLVEIARDIAANINPIETILETYGVTQQEWSRISTDPVFTEVLRQSIIEFQSALNGKQRVSIKTLAMIESSLPSFYASMVDPSIPLIQRTDLLKALGRFAGVGVENEHQGNNGGSQFQVRIFLGDSKPMVIEGSAVEPAGGPQVEAR